MKFQIVESCLVNGQHLEEGTIAELTNAEAAALYQAGRGYPAAEPVEITGDGEGEVLPPADNTPKIGKAKK